MGTGHPLTKIKLQGPGFTEIQENILTFLGQLDGGGLGLVRVYIYMGVVNTTNKLYCVCFPSTTACFPYSTTPPPFIKVQNTTK